MRFDVITLFPDMFNVVRDLGVTGRAHRQQLWSLGLWNPRDYTHDVHRTVDDRPYGGGPGMVMMAGPLEQAVDSARAARRVSAGQARHLKGVPGSAGVELHPDGVTSSADVSVPVSADISAHAADVDSSTSDTPVILMSPTGQRFDQAVAQELATGAGAILVCGRYEGVDQRFIDRCVTRELSLGDFVLSGGEVAALAIMDSVLRLLPGVLGDAQSAPQDSFNTALTGLLDSPHYTRPEQYEGVSVPTELLSGHHVNIAAWRRQQSLALTMARRPDLIITARKAGLLSKSDEAFLKTLTHAQK
ncbi:tRNA (guanosine(37)-N1)-methyltransferase TrmD [Pusillimonas sp. ANT_WB101]|uniref:tRNA (guanosine(37)-N1)-methyltransferase TrmD n=1 Tax=Pusillimonas sp. ANT_WB101 TaxID=2597356 RepID=UPI0011ED49C0|nr:tRNA (guanosine(37)-N1)-methyltransferase TrmD [Pusillimonas sp. ANT_WB101]KAA0911760.1 tRNA (guanosine(37)-N1)-methyltransferase TrmD [Pusillimonas sp. ANT_WB101]